MKQMLNISTTVMIEKHISAAEMRKTLGMRDIVHQMEYLQLKWHGRVRNMPLDRLPRQFLVSWLPSPRLRNYPQTQFQTVKKALATVGISEVEFPLLSKDPREWNRYTSQTLEDRYSRLRAATITTPADMVRSLHRADQNGVAGLNFRDSPRSIRRREFAVGGGVGTPQRDGEQEAESSTEQVDLRSIDPHVIP